MSKLAILQVADCSPLESLVVMLRAAGYRCAIPDARLRAELAKLGGLVLSPRDLELGMGYPPHMPLDEARVGDMDDCALYADVKAHQIHDGLVRRWPNLAGKVLWYRINGGRPEHVIRRDAQGNVTEDCGDEINPPCPVLTPNQWYSATVMLKDGHDGPKTILPANKGQAYVCWPPFVRWDDHQIPRAGTEGNREAKYGAPMCLLHNSNGWGYRDLIGPMRDRLGVLVHGRGSPDGLLNHREVPVRLSSAVAMVHMKSSDAPGYAIYEALASGCPLVCTRRLIWRCRMQELLIPGETCMVFDRETHDGLTEEDVRSCLAEVGAHLKRLRDPAENQRIGGNGRKQLFKVMWSAGSRTDIATLKEFLARNYGR